MTRHMFFFLLLSSKNNPFKTINMQHKTHSMKTNNMILDLAAKGTIRSNRKHNKAQHSLDENIVIYVLYIYRCTQLYCILHLEQQNLQKWLSIKRHKTLHLLIHASSYPYVGKSISYVRVHNYNPLLGREHSQICHFMF